MPDPASHPLRCYLVARLRGETEPVRPTEVSSLREALEAARACYAVAATGGHPIPHGARFDIVQGGESQGTTIVSQTSRRPDREYFVDLDGNISPGDGAENTPWSGIDAAIVGLGRLAADGELDLEPGQVLRLTHREVFSPTRLELRKLRRERVAKVAFSLMVAAMVLPVLAIIFYLFYRAAPVLSLSFIIENPRDYMSAGGIWAPLVGTFVLAIVSLAIDAPIGILAAIYLNEYARDNWFTRMINLAVVNLAGVPSIVHGLFGFGAFVLFAGMGKSVLAASCTLAVMSLPVIITATREALASVPMAFREACWNMGATRWQTIRTIVLPNSLSGILTGVIFEICRTAGETAPILFTGAVFYMKVADSGWGYFFPYGLFDTCMALQYHLFALVTQVRGVAEEVSFATAAVIISLTLLINSVSISLRIYLRSRKKW